MALLMTDETSESCDAANWNVAGRLAQTVPRTVHRNRRYLLLRAGLKRLLRVPHTERTFDDRPLATAEHVPVRWADDTPLPLVGLVRDGDPNAWWTKFERFLEYNRVPHRILDIHSPSWLDDARPFDAVVWRPLSEPTQLEEARRKALVLERLGKVCLPSHYESLVYEDKVLQASLLDAWDLPRIPTWVSFGRDHAMRLAATLDLPLVAKVSTSSGSLDVELLRSRQDAHRLVSRVFSAGGRATSWPAVRQQGYVLFQEYVPNASFDVRVIVVGPRLVAGYFRDVPRSDFRASGAGMVRKEALPADAVLLARRVSRDLDLPIVAVDMLQDSRSGCFLVIELSTFIRVDTPEQLLVDGVPGLLSVNDDGSSTFLPGRFWLQELALRERLESGWLPRCAQSSNLAGHPSAT